MLRVGALRALAVARVGVSDRRARDPFNAKPDEVVQTALARLSGRAASRATNAYVVRNDEIIIIY